MYCNKCGEYCPDNSKFCQNCGNQFVPSQNYYNPINESKAPIPPVPPQPPEKKNSAAIITLIIAISVLVIALVATALIVFVFKKDGIDNNQTITAVSSTTLPASSTTDNNLEPSTEPTSATDTTTTTYWSTTTRTTTTTTLPPNYDVYYYSKSYTGEVDAARGLNVRTGPGTNYGTKKTLKNGTYVTVLGCNYNESWYYVIYDYDSNKTGWVKSDFLYVYWY